MNPAYEQHPLSAAFPAMPPLELSDLVNDIRLNGLRNPIVIFEGKVLDGWHRYQACERLGHDPESVDFPEHQDPVAFVRSQNYHRRHLTPSQKAVAEVELRRWAQSGDNQHTRGGEPGSPPPSSNEQMAAAAEVTPRTIQQAKRVVEAGLADAVKSGEVSVKRAAEVAKLPEPERRAALEAPRPKPEPRPRAPIANPAPGDHVMDYGPLRKQIEGLKAQLEERDATIQELTKLLRDTEEENKTFARILEADDQVKQALVEAKRYRELARVVEERNRGLQGQNHALAKDATRWMNKTRRLEKAAKGELAAALEEEEPEPEPPPAPADPGPEAPTGAPSLFDDPEPLSA